MTPEIETTSALISRDNPMGREERNDPGSTLSYIIDRQELMATRMAQAIDKLQTITDRVYGTISRPETGGGLDKADGSASLACTNADALIQMADALDWEIERLESI